MVPPYTIRSCQALFDPKELTPHLSRPDYAEPLKARAVRTIDLDGWTKAYFFPRNEGMDMVSATIKDNSILLAWVERADLERVRAMPRSRRIMTAQALVRSSELNSMANHFPIPHLRNR